MRLFGDPQHSGMLAGLSQLPRHIVQPFSLAALAVVGAIVIAVFVGDVTLVLAALAAAVVLLLIGLRGTPREAVVALMGGQTYRPVSDVSASTPVDAEGLTGSELSGLETVCFLHTYVREGGSVGRNRVFPMNYFVDLMTAALIPSHLRCLTDELVDHIRRGGGVKGVTTLAGPKRGNPLLLTAVADKLGMEGLFIKERPLFGKTFEGIGGRPRVAAVLDDVSSDGDLLVHSVEVLRKAGYEVTTAFVLVDRKEGDAGDALKKVGVRLVPLLRLGDQDLEALAERGRRFAGAL